MAGEWIKLERGTADKPEIMKLARQLKADRDLVLGKLVRLWCWFDANSVDGRVDGVASTDVDALVMLPGFAAALMNVGWLDYDDEAEIISIPNFERHNGESAKKRALKNNRQTRWRRGRDAAVDAKVDSKVDAPPSTGATTREEKRREEDSVLRTGDPPRESPKDFLWRAGVELLTSAGEKESSARSFLGKLCKQHGDEKVCEAVGRAVSVKPAEPKGWLEGALRKANGHAEAVAPKDGQPGYDPQFGTYV